MNENLTRFVPLAHASCSVETGGQSIAACQFGEGESPNRQTKLDKLQGDRHNSFMYPTPEQTLKAHKKASAALMREIGSDANKARAYLVKIGILEKNKQAEHGVQLAKAYRSAE